VTPAGDDADTNLRSGRAATDEINSHRLGRRLALAALFEAEFGQRTAEAILERHLAESGADATTAGFARSLVSGVVEDRERIDALVERVRSGNFKEVIMATNPTVEGDGTSLHISNLLGEFPVQITRLARGITSGSVLEFANKEILADAIGGRQKF